MSTYLYSTARDASLFFESPAAGSDAPPARVAAGTTVPAFNTATGATLEPLVIREAGYVSQTFDCPRIDLSVGGDRITVYSAQWLATRGEGSAPAYWTWLTLPSDPQLVIVGDLCRFENGSDARYDGSQWVTVAASGGGAGGVVVSPAPSTGSTGSTGGTSGTSGTTADGMTDTSTTTPTRHPLPYTATFDAADGWVANPWHPGAKIANGTLTVSGDQVAHTEVMPVTVGSWVEVTASCPSVSGSASLVVMSYAGDSFGSGTYLGESSAALSTGTTTLRAQVLTGADRLAVAVKGNGNALAVVETLTVVASTAPTTSGGTTGGTGTSTTETTTLLRSEPFDSSTNVSTTTAGMVSGGALNITGTQRGYIKIENVTPGTKLRAVVTVANGTVGTAHLWFDSWNGGDWISSSPNDAGLISSTTTTKSLDYIVASGATWVAVGVDGNESSTVIKILDLKVYTVTGGTASTGTAGPTPPPSTTHVDKPASLVPGASPYSIANFNYLYGSTIWCKQYKGAPPDDPADPFRAGRAMLAHMTWDDGSDNSWVDYEKYNIPSQLVDTSKPEGPVSSGGGGYVWRDLHKHYLWEGQTYDEDLRGNNYNQFMTHVPFPTTFEIPPGTDKSFEWIDINPNGGGSYGGWGWEYDGGELKFATAARDDDTLNNYAGQWDKGSIMACGLIATPTHLGIEEVQEWYRSGRHIQHTIGVMLPECSGPWDGASWPALFQDSNNDWTDGLRQGARLVLDASFDVAKSGLSSYLKMLAYNLQEYGWVIDDTTHYSVTLRGELYRGTGTNPWDSLLPNWSKFRDLPWDRVYVSQKDWRP